MNAQTMPREALVVKAAEFVETNPTRNWSLILQQMGCGDTSDTYMLLQSIVDALHPINHRRCVDLAAEKGLILQ